MGDEGHVELCQDNVSNIQRMSTLSKRNNKGEKESKTFPNYFREKKMVENKGVLSIVSILKNLEI